ncbi:MAG: GAF domain-containing protein [Alphaproteobacteria bacterium]|nr:GAF domain-containing protein [Alphaproteobacteria bacterium]MBF0130142.1 GAF domain-containing protein [Alphaproteobacteria bacterium]
MRDDRTVSTPKPPRVSSARRTAEKLRQAELLLDISRRVAAFEKLDDVLAALVEVVIEVTGAERGSLFLNDSDTGELYSRIALGQVKREIRFLNNSGVAGFVYTTGEGRIIDDAYADPHFNRAIDQRTGFVTRTILCAPVKTVKGEVIGVIQALNKKDGLFTPEDLALVSAIATQAAVALQSTQFVERMERSRAQEMAFLDIVSDVTSEIDLGSLLQKVMGEATRMLNAERSTLFLNDEKTNELFSRVAMGTTLGEIRLPNHLGIAGAVFTSGKSVNIPHAYADLRFNPAFDKKTGFFTRSILCVPVVNKHGKTIGVTQALNRRGGPFTEEDESRLKAFTSQVAIGLENAKLFDDVQNMKNYNESMLESMSNGVITLDEENRIVTCNTAGLRIFKTEEGGILKRPAAEFFAGSNAWVMEKIQRVGETRQQETSIDAALVFGDDTVSVNATILPLTSVQGKHLGTMIMVEDISSEKRVKSTMARYMDVSLAEKLLEQGEDLLGGQSSVATVLFSDVRSFTTLTEELGAQGTVSLLNEYFTLMVDCLQKEGGMLDKFIGDAIMAIFGTPFPHEDDEDRAVRTACAMMSELTAFNHRRALEGKKPIDIGIGINTDDIVSGNIGSPKRMDYTVIGDGVNLAARLESACKTYSAHILISEHTFHKLRGTYRIREVDKVVVKGKTEPVAIHEVMEFHTPESFPNLMDVLGHFKDGLAEYRGARWDRAIAAFEKALAANPRDKLSDTYIGRCRHMIEVPPVGEWDGVWVMKDK